MTSPLQFDALSHSYSLDGQPLISVTRILDRVLGTTSPYWTPAHRLRGTFCHAVTAVIDSPEGWDPDAMILPEGCGIEPAEIIGRGQAYLSWKKQVGFEPEEIELPVYSLAVGVAGRLDRVGILTRGPYAARRAVVEIKSGPPTASAAPQVAAYQWMYDIVGKPVDVRVVLELKPSGKPRPEYRQGPEDLNDFLAAVRIYRLLERERLL